ncbi:hypothetical protein SELMODRAFT_408737 [Selaginella moellendorffii]|uniref:Uncharacterized protein n=1 Tax=Selaginella moellendorffii TaxID=88036 RepID=D8R9T2_SELML|nr:hypothetical protein SELMODRAFT_408737 [Selaginella moellendorffii]
MSFLGLQAKYVQAYTTELFKGFWTPFIEELATLFIDGIQMEYNFLVDQISPYIHETLACLHVMLFFQSRDHVAQCKIGQFKQSRPNFRRRLKRDYETIELDVGGHKKKCVYCNNRFQTCYPLPKGTLKEMKAALESIAAATIEKNMIQILHSASLSGQSMLWRFHDLYSFISS